MNTKLVIFLILTSAFILDAHAASATWSANPIGSDWNTAANWTPNTVPNGPNDVATFEASNQTDVTISTFTEVNELVFSPGASGFTINVTEGRTFTISGTGITNNSGIGQNFVVEKKSDLDLTNNATVGELNFFTVLGGTGSLGDGGAIFFLDTSSAGNGTFVVNGAADDFGNGAAIGFENNATAGNGTFTVKGEGTAIVFFVSPATAGNASFVIEGGNNEEGSVAFFGSEATAGNGIFDIKGGTTPGAFGGFVQFSGGTAGNATLITNSGTNGGFGGQIVFLDNDESEARIELLGGSLLASFGGGAPLGVGSIEGDGVIQLGGNLLITGANNLSTIFSGTINTGALTKIGTGILTLTGANIYTGGTTIEGGKLVVNNKSGSGTGSGPVQVNAGILAGRGTIAGAVTVGTSSGTRAALAPGRRGAKADTLTIQRALTFQLDSTYKFEFKASTGAADKVIANGVTINNGAFFSFIALDSGTLPQGTVLTAISNTSATPISRSFVNLPDGGTITIGNNTFQADYQGGDGNDLTLTVVP
jgi:autotransporter-associated beta strand protein